MSAVGKRPVLHKALVALVLRTLRPLACISFHYGMSILEFEEIARWVFVDVALRDPAFALQSRNKQFKSRAAILTGLSRKEVMRLARQPAPGENGEVHARNRAARVVAGWLQPPYTDGRGNPRTLALKEGRDSFAHLVRACGGDVPHRAILDELLESGWVEKVEGGRLKLRSAGRLHQRGSQEALEKAAASLEVLLAGLEKQLHADIERNGRRSKDS